MNKQALMAIFAVVLTLTSGLAVMSMGDSSDAAAADLPQGSDYGFVLTLSDSITIESVEYSPTASAARWQTLTTKSTAETAYADISSVLQFNATTGLGPFNTYYAAFNIDDTTAIDTGLQSKRSSAPGELAFIINPYDLSKTLAGESFTASAYNLMLVIPTVYWFANETHLYLTNNPHFFDGGKYTVGYDHFVPYAHTIDGTVRSWIALGVYESSFLGDVTNNTTTQGEFDEEAVLVSQSGKTPARWQTIDQFRTQANNLNANINSGEYMLWNYYQWTLSKMMDYTVMGTKNSQVAVGTGLTGGSAPATTGLVDNEAPFYGTTENATTSSKLFIENSIGSVWEFVDDTWFSDRVMQVGQNSIATLMEINGDHGLNTTNQAAVPAAVLPSSNNFQGAVSNNPECWDVPLAVGGSEDNGIGDWVSSASGARCLFVGGRWGIGAGAGVAYANADYALSVSSDSVGSRLAFAAADSADVFPIINGTVTRMTYGSTVADIHDPVKAGYTFGGWYSDAELSNAVTGNVVLGDGVNLYAKWIGGAVTVSFKDHSDNVLKTITVNNGGKISFQQAVDILGLNILGIYTDAELTHSWNPLDAFSENTTLYVKTAEDANAADWAVIAAAFAGIVLIIAFAILRRPVILVAAFAAFAIAAIVHFDILSGIKIDLGGFKFW